MLYFSLSCFIGDVFWESYTKTCKFCLVLYWDIVLSGKEDQRLNIKKRKKKRKMNKDKRWTFLGSWNFSKEIKLTVNNLRTLQPPQFESHVVLPLLLLGHVSY